MSRTLMGYTAKNICINRTTIIYAMMCALSLVGKIHEVSSQCACTWPCASMKQQHCSIPLPPSTSKANINGFITQFECLC